MHGRRQSATLTKLALAIAIALSIPFVLGFLGRLHPAFDAFSHFRAHLGVVLALSAILLLVAGLQWNAIAALALAAGGVATTLETTPWHAGSHAAEFGAPERAHYRLLHLNLRFDNPHPEKVLSLVARLRPDVLTFNEVSREWRTKLDLIAAAYPYRHHCRARTRVGSVSILSRRPFASEGDNLCAPNGRFAVAAIDFGGESVPVAAVHLGWPWPFEQREEVEAALPMLARLDDAAILAGDLNAAPWSALARLLRDGAGFLHAPRLGPTWLHRTLPKSFRERAGLPIDHVMGKARIEFHSAETLDDVGSDHLPVLVEFSISAASESEPSAVVLARGLALR